MKKTISLDTQLYKQNDYSKESILKEEQDFEKHFNSNNNYNLSKATQLEIGTKIESEHKDTFKFIKDYRKKHGEYPPEEMVYKQIAKDHLSEFKDYYTRLIAMEKQAEQEMSKAKKDLTKLVKKVIINSKGQQQTVYALPEGAKTEWLNKFMQFFNFKDSAQANRKLEADYKANSLDKKGVTWQQWKDHVSEYFNNKDKWDRFFNKSTEQKKETAKKEEQKAKKSDKKPKTAVYKLSLMKFIAGMYGKAPEKKEEEKFILSNFEKMSIEELEKQISPSMIEHSKTSIKNYIDFKNGNIQEAINSLKQQYNNNDFSIDVAGGKLLIYQIKLLEKQQENNFETMPENVVETEPEPVKEETKESVVETIKDKFERWKTGDLIGVEGQKFNMTKTMMGKGGPKTFFNEIIIEKISNGFLSYVDSILGREGFSGGFSEKGFISDLNNGSLIPVGLEKKIETDNGSKIETVKNYTPEQRKEVNNDAKEMAREGFFNEKPAEILNVGKDVWGAARHNYDTYNRMNVDVNSMEKDGTAHAYVTKKNLFGDYGLANKDERVKSGETEFKVLASFVMREYLEKIPPDDPESRTTYMNFCRAISRLDQETQNASIFYFGMAELFAQMFPVEAQKKATPDQGISVLDMIPQERKGKKPEDIIGLPLTALFYSLNQQANLSRQAYYSMDKKERKSFDAMTAVLLSETGKTNKSYNDIETMIFGATKLSGIKMKKGDNIVFAENLKDRVYTIRIDFASDADKAKHDALNRESNLINQDSNFAYLSNKEKEKKLPELNKKYGTIFTIEKAYELTRHIENLAREKASEAATYRIRTRIYPEEKGQIIKVGKNDIEIAFKFPDGKIRGFRIKPEEIKPENVESVSRETKKKQTRKLDLAMESKVIRVGGKSYAGASVPDMQKKLSDDFQFKAVQYGNSMPDTERQYHTQWTLESMSDLAEILNLPIEQITARGKLGVAFGARGSGFQMPGAVAHYESNSKMINLTRANGYGSLAHEWGHFMDNILSPDMHGYITVNPKFIEKEVNSSNIKVGSIYEHNVRKGKKYITERYYYDGKDPKYPFAKLNSGQFEPDDKNERTTFYKFREGQSIKVKEPDNLPFMDKAAEIARISQQSLQSQTSKAIEESPDEINKAILKEMILNDVYLNDRVECFARAFEAYISDKLVSMKRKNTYLASSFKTSEKDGKLIYPQDEFRTNINRLFDEFFDEIRKGNEMKKAIDNLLKQNKNVYIKKKNPLTGKIEYRKIK